MQRKEIFEKWINLLKPLFPEDANMNFGVRNRDYFINAKWLLKDDPNRPSKRSKMIEFIIEEEFMDNYLGAHPEEKPRIDRRLKEFVEQKLLTFDPHHDKSVYERIPVEEWLVPSNIIE